MDKSPHAGIYCILLIIFSQHILSNKINRCPELRTFAKPVDKCPSHKEEWKRASEMKNCESLSMNCTRKYAYHCLNDEWLDKMYEVCAPPVIIIGCCPEYNTAGDVIQGNFLIDCTKFDFPCPKVYNSTDIYKYQKCYGITVEEILSDYEAAHKQIMTPISATQIPTLPLLLRRGIRKKSVEGRQSLKMFWMVLWCTFVIFSLVFIIFAVCIERNYKIKKMKKQCNSKFRRQNKKKH